MSSRNKDTMKIDHFQVFPVLVVFWPELSIKIDGFGFEFNKISLFRNVENS